MASSTVALDVPEILEQVMLYASAKELLLFQRVATLWRDTVKRSVHLQRTLFRKPVTTFAESTALVTDDVCTEPGAAKSVVVRAVHPDKLESASHPRQSASRSPEPPWFTAVAVQPNFMLGTCHELVDDSLTPFDTLKHMLQHGTAVMFGLNQPIWPTDDESSLLDMYLTQPPIHEIEVHDSMQDTSYGSKLMQPHDRKLRNPDGIKVRDVMGLIKMDSKPSHRILSFAFKVSGVLFLNEKLEGIIERGIEKFAKLESKIGLQKALNINARGARTRQFVNGLLEGRALDIIMSMGRLDDVLYRGQSIRQLLYLDGQRRYREYWQQMGDRSRDNKRRRLDCSLDSTA